MSTSDASILFLHALTGLHPGTGTALGVVDLPVQRERHTQWPTIPGSSLKGVLRDTCRRAIGGRLREADAHPDIASVFGPPTANASDHAGALAVTDARILAFPVRSLCGVFAWVTCPLVLTRLYRDLVLAHRDYPVEVPAPARDHAVAASSSKLEVSGGKAVLEEFEFTLSNTGDDIADYLDKLTGGKLELKDRLLVLHDDDFTHFVRHATDVIARIGLNHESKTVAKGALFYEEYIPSESLFYSVVLADNPRSGRGNGLSSAADVLNYLEQKVPHSLQIGAGETIGKGFCAGWFLNGRSGNHV